MARLLVVRGTRAGQMVELGEEMVLGRAAHTDLQLKEIIVSREHARIRRLHSGEYVLEDLHSRNGTFVNDEETEETTLAAGDRVRIGTTECVFVEDSKAGGRLADDQSTLHIDGEGGGRIVRGKLDLDSSHSLQVALAADRVTSGDVGGRSRAIAEFQGALCGTLQEEQVPHKVLDELFTVFPDTRRGFVVFRQPESGKLSVEAAKNPDRPEEVELAMARSLLDRVLESGQAVLSEVPADETADRKACVAMCAPLRHAGDVQGFVLLEGREGASDFDEDGLGLLAGLAADAGLAIANSRMHSTLRQDQLFRQHMRNASRIQRSFLPESPPSVEGYEFAHWYETALEVGGDFYVFVQSPRNRVVTAVGDVSGRGIPAALLMAKLTTDIRLGTVTGEDPAEIIARINQAVLAANPETFATCIVCELDPSSAAVRIAGAGHPPPLRRHAEGSVTEAELGRSLPVGVSEHCTPAETELTLREGEKLCVFTDGITNAKNSDGTCFGRERLGQVVAGSSGHAEDIVGRLVKELDAHLQQTPQNDDVSIVCFGPR